MAPAALRQHLRDLRKRRGRFTSAAAAEAETARLLNRLRPGSLERHAFELSEIAGMPFKAIAYAMGISERHLYRVRVQMMQQLAGDESAAIVDHPIAPEAQQLELARTLLKYGHAQRAKEISKRILDSSTPVSFAVAAMAVQAMAMSDQERYDQAQAVLENAQRYIWRLEADEAPSAARAIAMARAYIPYRDGESGRAIELSEEALAAPQHSNDPFEVRAYARDLIFLGVQHEEAGSPRRSLECLLKAREQLIRLPVPPAAELARVHIQSALTRSAIPEEAASAHNDAAEALKLAQWHGLGYEEIWANLTLAALNEIAGRPRDGLPMVHRALQLATSMCAGDPLIRTLFITARLEGACGLGERALARLDAARPLTKNHGLLRGILHVAQARLYRQCGETQKTIEASTRAIDRLEGRALTHYTGIPYLARAVARKRLGEAPIDDVERAAYYLERGGSLSDMASALELSHALTNNRRHLQRSRELREAAAALA